MKRYSTVSLFAPVKIIDYQIPKVEYDPSVTDDSYFIPVSEAVKKMTPFVGNASTDQYFDFPSGRDTGREVPLGRKPGMDIAEVSTAVREEASALEAKSEKAKKDLEQRLKFDQAVAELAKSRDAATATSNVSTTPSGSST